MAYYNTLPAVLHISSDVHYVVTIIDGMPGKNGFTGIIYADGRFEFTDDDELTYNTSDINKCLTCDNGPVGRLMCADCLMDNHDKCTGELWTSKNACECTHREG